MGSSPAIVPESINKVNVNSDAGNHENVSPFQTPLAGPVSGTNDDRQFVDLNGITLSRFIGSRGTCIAYNKILSNRGKFVE